LDVLSTSEGSAAEDDSYLGYSSAVGDLDDDGRTDVAVGMPRGANLTGKVNKPTNDSIQPDHIYNTIPANAHFIIPQ